MQNEFTASVERDGPWYIAYSPEITGANGQGKTKAAALKSLASAIALILEDRRKDGLRGVPATARREKVAALDQSRYRGRRSSAASHRDIRHPGSQDLPRPLCA